MSIDKATDWRYWQARALAAEDELADLRDSARRCADQAESAMARCQEVGGTGAELVARVFGAIARVLRTMQEPDEALVVSLVKGKTP